MSSSTPRRSFDSEPNLPIPTARQRAVVAGPVVTLVISTSLASANRTAAALDNGLSTGPTDVPEVNEFSGSPHLQFSEFRGQTL